MPVNQNAELTIEGNSLNAGHVIKVLVGENECVLHTRPNEHNTSCTVEVNSSSSTGSKQEERIGLKIDEEKIPFNFTYVNNSLTLISAVKISTNSL